MYLEIFIFDPKASIGARGLKPFSLVTMYLSGSFRGVQWVQLHPSIFGKDLGKDQIAPIDFWKDHRLHPSIENPKAAAGLEDVE